VGILAHMSEALEQFIDESIWRSRERGYHPTGFIDMRERRGTKGAIERLVISGDIQSGFKRLKELKMLEWTIEAAVLKFPEVFTNREVRAAAEWRLRQAREES
jgi:hypothetical protein